MKKILYTIFGLLLIMFIGGMIKSDNPSLGGGSVNRFQAPTATTRFASSTPNEIISAFGGRQYVDCWNPGSVDVYLHPSATSTGVTTTKGILLSASGGRYTIDTDNLFSDALWAVAATTTNQSITCVEK